MRLFIEEIDSQFGCFNMSGIQYELDPNITYRCQRSKNCHNNVRHSIASYQLAQNAPLTCRNCRDFYRFYCWKCNCPKDIEIGYSREMCSKCRSNEIILHLSYYLSNPHQNFDIRLKTVVNEHLEDHSYIGFQKSSWNCLENDIKIIEIVIKNSLPITIPFNFSKNSLILNSLEQLSISKDMLLNFIHNEK